MSRIEADHLAREGPEMEHRVERQRDRGGVDASASPI